MSSSITVLLLGLSACDSLLILASLLMFGLPGILNHDALSRFQASTIELQSNLQGDHSWPQRVPGLCVPVPGPCPLPGGPHLPDLLCLPHRLCVCREVSTSHISSLLILSQICGSVSSSSCQAPVHPCQSSRRSHPHGSLLSRWGTMKDTVMSVWSIFSSHNFVWQSMIRK